MSIKSKARRRIGDGCATKVLKDPWLPDVNPFPVSDLGDNYDGVLVHSLMKAE